MSPKHACLYPQSGKLQRKLVQPEVRANSEHPQESDEAQRPGETAHGIGTIAQSVVVVNGFALVTPVEIHSLDILFKLEELKFRLVKVLGPLHWDVGPAKGGDCGHPAR